MKVLPAFDSSNKTLLIFFIKLVVIYFILDLCYTGYVGLVDPKGSFDFTNTLGRFNLIDYITQATTYPVSWLLKLIGFSTYLKGNVVGIEGFRGIKILFPCLGIKMWIVFFSLIAAYPTKQNWKTVSIFLLLGIFIIHFFNIVRMFLLTLTNRYYGSESMHEIIFQRHHDVFNLVVGGVVLAMFYVWVCQFNSSKQIKDHLSFS